MEQLNQQLKQEQEAVQQQVQSELNLKIGKSYEFFKRDDSLAWLEETVDKLLEARENHRQPSPSKTFMSSIPADYKLIRDELCSALDKVIMEDQFLEEIRKVKRLLFESIWSDGFRKTLETFIRLEIIKLASNR